MIEQILNRDFVLDQLRTLRAKMRLSSLALAAAVPAVLAACTAPAEHAHWTYAGESGQEKWGALAPEFATCATGRGQSPIDLVNPVGKDTARFEIHHDGRSATIVNTGHSIQVDVDSGSWLLADGKRWNLVQFHFHTPSEHTVSGASFPLEAHFVHRSDVGELAVVGVVFRDGTADTRLASIAARLPARVGEKVALALGMNELGLLPIDARRWRYDGSLTTPPCTEGVRWFVMQTARRASPEQIAGFTRVSGTNARSPQPLNGRQIRQ